MAKFKTRSDDEIAWSNKPGNRGKTYPGDEMARKEYDRDQARGENNLSFLRNLFSRNKAVPLGEVGDHPKDTKGAVELKEKPASSMDEVDTIGQGQTIKKGGVVKTKKMASGGTASSRADGCAVKGKTKGRFV
jgi:hypothetical protein